jgi:hypothetical protein
MPRLHHPGVDLMAAYLVLNLVAGYGYDKHGSGASRPWTIAGLLVAALVVLALELHARHHEPPGGGPDQG